MPSLNFMTQFADDVETGRKGQSIRAKNRFKVGDTVYLYTGMRTKKCRKLGEGIVESVEPLTISDECYETSKAFFHSLETRNRFARADGFKSWSAMRDWFQKTHGLPFKGWLIKWKLITCKSCGKPINRNQDWCQHCGANDDDE